MSTLDDQMSQWQKTWRRHFVSTPEAGIQNKKKCMSILPEKNWWEGLWPGIRRGEENDLEAYLDRSGVKKHRGVHNLKSSWVLCANLYFAHKVDTTVIGGFLAGHLDEDIVGVEALELEWAEDDPLDPASLLGESGGVRGVNQTSPDVAFVVRLRSGGRGLVLTEVKFTEHSFYRCPGRTHDENENPERCLSGPKVIENPGVECHLVNWAKGRRKNRRYWEHLTFADTARTSLVECPAAKAGYQLFRQQALAEAIAKSGKYDSVFSVVAYDERNATLFGSMRSAGLSDFTHDWSPLFEGKARFATFSHQEWVDWVRRHDFDARWERWTSWVAARYCYYAPDTADDQFVRYLGELGIRDTTPERTVGSTVFE